MNNDALVAALGTDAVAAVHGYRLRVISEAERRGLRLVSEPLSEIVQLAAEVRIIDPIDIRLTFHHSDGRGDLAGRLLRWAPAHGWSLSHIATNAPLSYYAGPAAGPLHLVPHPAHVVEWAATTELDGPATPPVGIELDDHPDAIKRLLGFIDPQRRMHPLESFAPAHGQAPDARASADPPTVRGVVGRESAPRRDRPRGAAPPLRHEQKTG